MFQVTETGHAKILRVVGWFRGDKPPCRERQDNTSEAAQPPKPFGTAIKAGANSVFLPRCTSEDARTSSSEFVSASAHPRDPIKGDRLLAGARTKNQPAAATLRGGRVPSLASLVANGFSLTLFRFFFSYLRTQRPSLDRDPKNAFSPKK